MQNCQRGSVADKMHPLRTVTSTASHGNTKTWGHILVLNVHTRRSLRPSVCGSQPRHQSILMVECRRAHHRPIESQDGARPSHRFRCSGQCATVSAAGQPVCCQSHGDLPCEEQWFNSTPRVAPAHSRASNVTSAARKTIGRHSNFIGSLYDSF